MPRILDALYRDELNPLVNSAPRGSEYKRLTRDIIEESAYVRENLSPEAREHLDRLEDFTDTSGFLCENSAFSRGFQLGALLMCEIFTDNGEKLDTL